MTSLRNLLRFPHPLAGTIDTPVGSWTIEVVKDVDADGLRRFTLRLMPAGQRESDAQEFEVVVPRSVIQHERASSWHEDLKQQLAVWIVGDMTLRGEMIWWPPSPDQTPQRGK
jgi:hypothetical protein